jgi:hypothetical protein
MSYKGVDRYLTTEWYNERGDLHRENDLPAIEYANGDKLWYANGILHREGGPAISFINGYKEWWLHGELHREDGPAIEYSSGSKEWWVNNVQYSYQEYKKEMRYIKLKQIL